MSAGCVHQKASVILAIALAAGSLYYGSLGPSVGALAGILLSGDLDVDAGNISNTIIKKRVGSWAERGWSLLWYFYRGSIKHGSPLSHFPIISTIGRLAYLYLFLIVLPYTFIELVFPGAWDVGTELRWWAEQLLSYRGMILGLMGSDFIHWGLDILTTEHAKKKRTMIFGMPVASSKCR